MLNTHEALKLKQNAFFKHERFPKEIELGPDVFRINELFPTPVGCGIATVPWECVCEGLWLDLHFRISAKVYLFHISPLLVSPQITLSIRFDITTLTRYSY